MVPFIYDRVVVSSICSRKGRKEVANGTLAVDRKQYNCQGGLTSASRPVVKSQLNLTFLMPTCPELNREHARIRIFK